MNERWLDAVTADFLRRVQLRFTCGNIIGHRNAWRKARHQRAAKRRFIREGFREFVKQELISIFEHSETVRLSDVVQAINERKRML